MFWYSSGELFITITVMEEFFTWLNGETDKRGWSISELARRSGQSRSAIHATITGRNAVSFEFCVGIGRALNLPAEDVMRMAGLLPPVSRLDVHDQLLDAARSLSSEQVGVLLRVARALQHERERRHSQK